MKHLHEKDYRVPLNLNNAKPNTYYIVARLKTTDNIKYSNCNVLCSTSSFYTINSNKVTQIRTVHVIKL